MHNNSLFFVLVFVLIAALTSCSKSATCECTTKETLDSDGTVISTSKETFQSAGNDPTCDDFESVTGSDTTTITITCVAL